MGMVFVRRGVYAAAEPNAGHLAVARMEPFFSNRFTLHKGKETGTQGHTGL